MDDSKIAAHNNTSHIDHASPPKSSNAEEGDYQLAGASLGTLVMEVNGKVVLVPTPSTDPNDPLNWSQGFKIYIAIVACVAVFLSNFLAAGPTVDIVAIAIEFTGPPPTLNIAKIAYLFTTSALWQGAGMFFWIPLINKTGRRPVYVISFVFFFLCTVWAALGKTYNQELVARMGIGLFSGGAECLCPLTITDIFFAHERGTYMGVYQVLLSIGVSVGIIVSGLVVHGTGNWRNIYWVGAGLIGFSTLLVVFTFPETAYHRTQVDRKHVFASGTAGDVDSEKEDSPKGATEEVTPIPPLKTYWQKLRLFSGTYTQEPFWKMFLRPFGLVLLPAVLWGALLFAVTVGFLIGITSNFAIALGSPPYLFTPFQSSLCFSGGVIGGFLAIPFAGHLGDWIAARGTHKNDGVREPEFRLPALYHNIILAPLALILYGVGIEKSLHWMVPTM